MLESNDLKRIVYRLVDFINPKVNFDMFTDVIDKYSGNESYGSSDVYEKLIIMQLDYIDEQKRSK